MLLSIALNLNLRENTMKNSNETSANINTDDILEKFSGSIDGDGDFKADAEISTDQFGNEGELLFIKSNVIAELNGNQTSDNEQSCDYKVGDDLYLSSSYEKMAGESGDEFSINVKLDIYKTDQSKSMEISEEDYSKSISINDCTFSIISTERDEDGDLSIGYKLTLGSPHICGFKIGTKDDEYPSSSLMECEAGDEESSLYVMNVSEGEPLICELFLMKPAISDLSLNSVGEITVEEVEESDDSFFNDEEDDQLNIFIGCIEMDTPLDEGDGDIGLTGEKIRTRLLEAMNAITEHVDEDAKFFINNLSGEMTEVSNISDLEICLPLSTAPDLDKIAREMYFQLRFSARGNQFWNDQFLSASADIPESISIWGYFPNLGELAVQGYYEGDLDTGIVNDPDDDSDYCGEAQMEHFGLKPEDFDIKNYGLEP
jgi:hypothetical protein